jgi:hypothetical protein
MGIELASICVICAATDTISMIFNFIALTILAEFDNFVYKSMKNEQFKQLTSKRFLEYATKIQHTTSKKCSETELSIEIDENGNNRPLKVTFLSRTWFNKILFVLYKILRIFYVSIFYYFLPFSTIVISALVPIFYRNPII